MATNPYDDAASDIFGGQLALGARSGVAQVADTNPDQEAQVQRKAKLLGVPPTSAAANPGITDKRLAADGIDYDNLARQAPSTARFLSSTSNAAIAHDDIGVLGRLEQGLRFIANPGRVIADLARPSAERTAGNTVQEVHQFGGPLGYLSALGRDVAPEKLGGHLVKGGLQMISGLIGTAESAGEVAAQNPIYNQVATDFAGLSRAARRKVDQLAYKVAPDQPETTVGAGVQSGIESLPISFGALATTLATDGVAPSLSLIGATTYGQSYGQARDQGVSVDRATAKSAIDAAVEMATEYLPERFFLSDAHAHATLGRMLLDQVKSEVPGEQVATLLQDFNQWAMIDANHGKSFEDYTRQIIPDALQTLIATGVGLGGPLSVSLVARGVGRLLGRQNAAQAAQAAAQHVEDLSALATASKLRERAPATFQTLVEEMSDGSPAENVYVDPRTLADALFQSGFDEDQGKAVDNAFGPKIKDALEQGTDVQVPISEFSTLLAGTPAEKALIDHLKVDPNGMTRAEAEEFMATKGDALKADIEQELQRTQADTVHQGELDQVRSNIMDELARANRFTAKVNERYADLQTAFYGTLARRLSVSPNTLYERYPIRISNAAMQPDSQFAQRFNDLMASFGKPPKPGALANDNSAVTLKGPAGERFTALEPAHTKFQEGDVLAFNGESGKVTKANKKSVTLALPSGSRIVPRDHPDLKVAPLAAWAEEYRQSDAKPIFYSELERAIEKTTQAKASPEQWLATLSKTPGVKKEEIEWTELPEWLATQDGPITREELLSFVRAGGVQVEEVDHTDEISETLLDDEVMRLRDEYINEAISQHMDRFPDDDEEAVREGIEDRTGWADFEDSAREGILLRGAGVSQFESYTEDGGEDYHELLLTLPPGAGGNPERAPSTHFDEPGVVAHLRFKTRSTTDGKKLLFIEEVQSDWHQKGRDQGYAGALTHEEKVAKQRARAEAVESEHNAARHLTATLRDKVTAELAALPTAAEPEMPAVGGAYTKHYLDQVVGEALRAERGQDLRNFLPNLRYERDRLSGEPQSKAEAEFFGKLIDYTEALAKNADRAALERAANDLSTERAPDAVLGRVGYSFGYSNSANLAFDPAVRDAEDAYRDAQLKLNEASQALDNTKGIPDAPFKATWPALVMKRAIRWAVDNGFEAVAWTTGEQQRERYNLASVVGEISAKTLGDGNYSVVMAHNASNAIVERGLGERMAGTSTLKMTPEQIAEVFGKDLGSRMMALADQQPQGTQGGTLVHLRDDDLKIGGEGMLAFYDRNLVNITNGILKKLGGAKVEMLPVEGMEGARDSEKEQAYKAAFNAYTDALHAAGLTEDMMRLTDGLTSEQLKQYAGLYLDQEAGSFDNRAANDREYRGAMSNADIYDEFAARYRDPAFRATVPDSIEHLRVLKQASDTALDEARKTAASNPGFTITPEIASHAREGFALFQKNRGAYSPATDTISLLEHADLSTFLHESGHFFLETYSRLVGDGNAPQQINDDFNAFLKWAKIKDVATWQSLTLEQRREAHEKFARAFEAYLFTGRAPAPRLRDLFRTFRAWLTAVYRHVRNLGVQPTPQIRQVMDRMLASDEEIAQAEAARSMEPLFADQAQSGMTEDQWQDYQRTNATATEDASQSLASRSLRDLKWLDNARSREVNRLKRQADAIRKSTRARVAAEVATEPIYRAQQYFKRGTLDGETVEGPHKLSIESVDKALDGNPDAAEIKRKLGYGNYGVLAAQGLDAEATAQAFGFASADRLVASLASAEPMADRIAGLTEQRLLEEHGDVTDPQSIEEAASEAVHNEFRARAVAAELAALAKATGKPRLLAQAARQFAEDTVARTTIRNLKPTKYEAAASRAAKAAMQALSSGNLAQAALEKRNQLFNIYAAKGAMKARDEIAKALALFDRLTRPATAKSIEASYRDQIVQLLDRYDLSPNTTLKDIDKRVSLAEWAERQREQGFDPAVPDDLVNDARRRSYKTLTVEELRGLVDSVRSIEHLGRLKSKLLTARKDRDFAEAVERAASTIIGNAATFRRPKVERNTWADKAKAGAFDFLALHRKFASLIRQMDGFKDGGPLWELLVRPMNEAGDRETAMRAAATQKLIEATAPLKQENLTRKQFIPAIGASLSLEGRLAVALNMGNETNRARLRDGDNWTDEQIDAIGATLTAQQWAVVQGVWDQIDSYWPEIAAKQRRVTGVEPEKVEGEPFQVVSADGQTLQLPGGYYPIKYDSDRSAKAEADDQADIAKAMLRGAYTRATTRRGHTEARVDTVKRPVRKDIGVIGQHLTEVIHDLSWHEYLIDANRLLGSGQIDAAIRDHYGPEVVRAMKNTLVDVAAGDVPAANFFERSVNWLRTGATIAGMAWSMTTALLQPFGLAQSVVRIGPKHVARGLGRWLGDAARMQNTVKWITEQSPMMAHRASTLQREISEIRNHVVQTKAGRANEAVKASFFYLIAKLQLVADVPTWIGQYQKSIDGGEEHERAVALADQAVLDSQGGGQIKDLAGIQRGGPLLKIWTNFYSYFSVTYNLAAESVGETRRVGTRHLPILAADLILLYAIPNALQSLLIGIGRGDDWDEIERNMGMNVLLAPFQSMVLVRDIAAALSGDERSVAPAGVVGRLFYKLGVQVQQGDADEAFWKSLNQVGGVLFHYPAAQVQRTATGIQAIANGETSNPMAVLLGPPQQSKARVHY
jgi:hypothetical protein